MHSRHATTRVEYFGENSKKYALTYVSIYSKKLDFKRKKCDSVVT